jgi:hypothetical protein
VTDSPIFQTTTWYLQVTTLLRTLIRWTTYSVVLTMRSNASQLLSQIGNGPIDPFESFLAYLEQWIKDGKGLMAHNGIDVGIKLRPSTEKDFKQLGDEFKKTWAELYANAPDKAVVWSGLLNAYSGTDPNAKRRKYFSGGYFTVSLDSVYSLS